MACYPEDREFQRKVNLLLTCTEMFPEAAAQISKEEKHKMDEFEKEISDRKLQMKKDATQIQNICEESTDKFEDNKK